MLAGRSRAGSLAPAAQIASASPGVVSAEVVPPPSSAAAASRVYHIQKVFGPEGRIRGRVRTYDEDELARRIRRGRLTGVELVRRDDQENWQPLFESSIYRREVPSAGDPRDAVRWRLLQAMGAHFSGFFITGVVMYSITGHIPFWMGIWGAVLAMQAFRAVPAAWTLLSRRRLGEGPGQASPGLPAGQAPQPPQLGATSSVAQEAARVRELLEQRGGSDKRRLLAEVDGILKLTGDLAARQADLEEQTSDRERAELAAAVSEASARLERAELAQDRRLFERQLQVLRNREEAIAKAVRVLERLRARREMAEHQLKQLRLDLSRGAATGLDVPELSSRLEFIRYEVDAKEEVDEILADRA
jgi:hypothetical protein